jgi:hypothetical protein
MQKTAEIAIIRAAYYTNSYITLGDCENMKENMMENTVRQSTTIRLNPRLIKRLAKPPIVC